MENSFALMRRKNTVAAYAYMLVMTLIITLLGYVLSRTFHWGLSGTGGFLIAAGIFNFIAYYFSDKFVIATSRAKPLSKEMAPEYVAIVEKLCMKSNLPIPKLYYIDEDAMNAFATGRSPQHAAVVATRGLLEKLTPKEVEGVIAHELSHIKSLDMRLMSIVSILAGALSILADMYWRSTMFSRAQDRDRSGVLSITGLVLAIFAPISAILIQLAISRKREFAADALGAEITADPLPLASALEKISRDHRPLPQMTHATAHLCLANPFRSHNIMNKLFSTHPPIEERIRILRSIKS